MDGFQCKTVFSQHQTNSKSVFGTFFFFCKHVLKLLKCSKVDVAYVLDGLSLQNKNLSLEKFPKRWISIIIMICHMLFHCWLIKFKTWDTPEDLYHCTTQPHFAQWNKYILYKYKQDGTQWLEPLLSVCFLHFFVNVAFCQHKPTATKCFIPLYYVKWQ